MLYIVMELVDGASLLDHITSTAEKGRRMREERVDIFLQTCSRCTVFTGEGHRAPTSPRTASSSSTTRDGSRSPTSDSWRNRERRESARDVHPRATTRKDDAERGGNNAVQLPRDHHARGLRRQGGRLVARCISPHARARATVPRIEPARLGADIVEDGTRASNHSFDENQSRVIPPTARAEAEAPRGRPGMYRRRSSEWWIDF